MKNKPVVIHQNCHSRMSHKCHPRGSLSGISTLFSSSPLEGEGGTQCRVRGYQRAFTLIELLVVVLIIGILAAVAVPQYQKAVVKSQYAKALTYLDTLVKAQQVYYLANGTYATHFSELDLSLPLTSGNCTASFATDKANIEDLCIFLEQFSYRQGEDTVTSYAIRATRNQPDTQQNGYVFFLNTPPSPTYWYEGLHCITPDTWEFNKSKQDGHCDGMFKVSSQAFGIGTVWNSDNKPR